MKSIILLVIILTFIPCYAFADIGPHYDETNGYNHSDSTYCYGDHYKGQQFTNEDAPFTVRSISVYGKLGAGAPDRVVASIYSVRENGHPTGKALATSGEVNCSGWSTSFEWHMFDVVHYELSPNTMYAIVIKNSRGDSDNFIKLSFTKEPTYEGGSVVRSTDGGFEWVNNLDADLPFILMDKNSLPNNEDPVISTPEYFYDEGGGSNKNYWLFVIPIGIIVIILTLYLTRPKIVTSKNTKKGSKNGFNNFS